MKKSRTVSYVYLNKRKRKEKMKTAIWFDFSGVGGGIEKTVGLVKWLTALNLQEACWNKRNS